MRLRLTVSLVLAVAGCGDDDGGGGGASGAAPTTSPTAAVGTDPGTQGESGMQRLDVTASAEGSGTRGGADDSANNDEVCERVDVILAVDNSSSMEEEIAALRGPVFDSFPDALLNVGNGLLDFHLAVIDGCNNPAAFHDTGQSGACGFSTGANYMTSASDQLAAEYACVTDLTETGYMGMPDACSGSDDDEAPGNTAADAVVDALGQNSGFLRDDAVLLVVAITDEDERPVPEQTTQQIADKLIAAKGTLNNVVFLGIGGSQLCEGPYGTAIPATGLQQLAGFFEGADRGLFWDLCDGDLTAAFQAAIEVVDTACVDFEDVEP